MGFAVDAEYSGRYPRYRLILSKIISGSKGTSPSAAVILIFGFAVCFLSLRLYADSFRAVLVFHSKLNHVSNVCGVSAHLTGVLDMIKSGWPVVQHPRARTHFFVHVASLNLSYLSLDCSCIDHWGCNCTGIFVFALSLDMCICALLPELISQLLSRREFQWHLVEEIKNKILFGAITCI